MAHRGFLLEQMALVDLNEHNSGCIIYGKYTDVFSLVNENELISVRIQFQIAAAEVNGQLDAGSAWIVPQREVSLVALSMLPFASFCRVSVHVSLLLVEGQALLVLAESFDHFLIKEDAYVLVVYYLICLNPLPEIWVIVFLQIQFVLNRVFDVPRIH